MSKSYFEKLKDPRWQRKRLEVLSEADFQCQNCYDKETTLHVHHKEYFKGREPWEYENNQLAVLCENCHAGQHEVDDLLRTVCSFLPVDGPHSRDEAAGLLAGWAYIQHPDLSLCQFSILAGSTANLLSGYGPQVKIGEAMAIADAAYKDPVGMVRAMMEFADSLGKADST